MRKNGQLGLVTVILCIIALFIPTYIAIGAFISGPGEEYTQKQEKITAVVVTDSQGALYTYTDDNGKSMLELFSGMLKSAKNVSTLPESAASIMPFSVAVTTEAGERSYSFYFNPKGKSYYTDKSQGDVYVYAINDDRCSEFFATEAAMCLFLDTPAPTLKNAFGDVILATSLEWQYRDHNGSYRPAPTTLAPDASQSYTLDGAFTLEYDIAPDYEKVILFNADGTVAYDGLRDGIAQAVTMMKADTFRMKLEAKWYESEDKSYAGVAIYEFVANVHASAHFTLGENSVEAGQVAVINAANIQDPSLIKVTFTPALKYELADIPVKFYGNGTSYSALVAIPASCFNDNAQTGKSMKYQIDISYGDASFTLNLDVTDRTGITTKKADADKADVEKYRTEQALATFKKLLEDTASKTANAKHWTEDRFYSYYANKYSFAYSYGKMWELSTGDKYRNEFIHYKLKEGKAVYSVNDGIVVATGENDLLGKYIAIDHGMGLQSWYFHLSDISVSMGDKVAYEGEIGKSGSTGFVEMESIGLSMMFTVNGVPVCPYSQDDNGKGLEETGLNMVAFAE